jgi:NADH:ubiquinone oxidoreductase subunit F (NADH-binding)
VSTSVVPREPRTASRSPRLPAVALPRLIASPPATSLRDHLDRFGPLVLPHVHDAGRLVDAVGRAGLRGRGGAAFPTGTKLEAVRRSASATRTRRLPVVVANGTEGEPASVKDTLLLSLAPHLVLDGMVAAARAVGAEEAVICIDRENRPAVDAVRRALHERDRSRQEAVQVRLAEAPAHYVTGEESALVHWLNGGDAKPTKVPPRPFERGLAGRPTLVDNVETLAHVALITRFGPAWWRSMGTSEDPGSCLTTVTGASRLPAVFEVPYGLPLLTLLDHAAVEPGQGVLVGGYFGTWLSPDVARSVTLSRSGLAAAGASLGCGAVVALPEDVCPLMELARVTRWLAGESAGQCGSCMFGLPAIAGAVEDLAAGGRPRESLAALHRWLPMVDKRGACKLPDGVVRFVSSGLQVFADHLAEHRRHTCRHTGAAAVLPVPARRGPWR